MMARSRGANLSAFDWNFVKARAILAPHSLAAAAVSRHAADRVIILN
jgi:hypothetical protein